MKFNIILLEDPDRDPELENFLRDVSEKYNNDPQNFASKYGANYEDENVYMRTFCYCDNPDGCNSCIDYGTSPPSEDVIKNMMSVDDDGLYEMPNFWYKSLDFKVRWYKYIGRGMEKNKNLSDDEFTQMKKHLLG